MTKIVVVDNHGQFTHLELRAFRDLGVECDLVENTTHPADIEADGFVLSGGPSMDDIGECPAYLEDGRPVLGICLGMQLMAAELGGTVESGDYGGYADVTVDIHDPDDPLTGSLYPETSVWASHADQVAAVPDGFEVTASSDICPIEAMSNTAADHYGVQWHPEVSHTAEGEALLENFIEICTKQAATLS